MHFIIALLPLISAGDALDFEWSFRGERYWAKEIARFPRNDTLASQLGPEGVGRFSIGSVDWPQFTSPLQGYALPAGAYQVTAVGDSLVFGQVYNIKSDPAIAFMDGCIPDTTDAGAFEEYSAGIPVPLSIGSGPLGGLHFAVKDIFHVEGLKTSGGSRAYRSTYGPQNFTNEIVAKSVAAGAQLVGKTKTIAFALGTPRNGWEVDYQDPWSFRGDGYQTTGGSSSGSSAAIAAYDWLDFTVGSDTGGSVRYPARFVGFYGLKPSHGVYNLTGILPAIAEQDTPGFMARSPSVFVRVGREWLKGTSLVQSSRFPCSIQYWSDEPRLEQPEAEAMKLDFFSHVQTALNITSTAVNISASFQANVVPNTTLNSYYYTVYQDQNSVQSWDRIGAPLAEAYAAQNDGAFPPTDPVVNLTWADGANETTRARYAEAVRRREQYAAWFNTHILPISNATCSESIAAHSLHVPPSTVKYDQTPFHLVRGYSNGMQASFAGFPEIVVPIGQVRYWSPFTRKKEWQTVTVAFAAAKGCDVVLLNLVEKLEKLGLIEEVMTGKVAYSVAE